MFSQSSNIHPVVCRVKRRHATVTVDKNAFNPKDPTRQRNSTKHACNENVNGKNGDTVAEKRNNSWAYCCLGFFFCKPFVQHFRPTTYDADDAAGLEWNFNNKNLSTQKLRASVTSASGYNNGKNVPNKMAAATGTKTNVIRCARSYAWPTKYLFICDWLT